jgi:Replication-relaxation
VRLPAAAVVQTGDTDATCLRLLLLPDLGTTPLASYRPTLRALTDLRRSALAVGEDEPVLVVGIAISSRLVTARAQAWQSLLHLEGSRRHAPPLPNRVLALQNRLTRICSADGQSPRPSAAGKVDEVFALVARHPLVSR